MQQSCLFFLEPTNTLRELFSGGTKFRPTSCSSDCLLKAINKGISKFVVRLEEALGVQGIFSHWNCEVLRKVSLKLNCMSRKDSSHLPSFELDLIALLRFHRGFVISYVDKCSNNFVFSCKKFYLDYLFKVVSSSTYSVSVASPKDILLRLL